MIVVILVFCCITFVSITFVVETKPAGVRPGRADADPETEQRGEEQDRRVRERWLHRQGRRRGGSGKNDGTTSTHSHDQIIIPLKGREIRPLSISTLEKVHGGLAATLFRIN